GWSRSTARAQQPTALAVPVAALFGVALVVKLFAARQRNFELRATLLVEIKLERHDGEPFALDAGGEPVDLAVMQQQPAGTFRRVIVERARLQIFRNVGIDEPEAAIAGIGIGFTDAGAAAAQGFDLGA